MYEKNAINDKKKKTVENEHGKAGREEMPFKKQCIAKMLFECEKQSTLQKQQTNTGHSGKWACCRVVEFSFFLI